jgi:hypothetical protein
MRKVEKLILVTVFTFLTANVFSQQNGKDSLYALRELTKLRHLYEHLPVQINIEVENAAIPFTIPQDTLQSEMSVYFSKPDIYIEAEGLEEIVNDSLIIMVNNPAKQITLYPNDQDVMKKIQETVSMVLPDSSLKALAEKYTSLVQDVDGSIKKIKLSSREMLYGTRKPKEIITVIYKNIFYQPIEINDTKLRLVPVDSAVYANLVNEKIYDGKLVSASTSKGNMFFLVKELTTSYRLKKIDYKILHPPAKQQDRVIKVDDGSYAPARGYEDYLISKEF